MLSSDFDLMAIHSSLFSPSSFFFLHQELHLSRYHDMAKLPNLGYSLIDNLLAPDRDCCQRVMTELGLELEFDNQKDPPSTQKSLLLLSRQHDNALHGHTLKVSQSNGWH